MTVRVKICGLTRAEDVALAVSLGAHAVGVVLAPSPRRVEVGEAAAILEHAGPRTLRVGVFVDPAPDFVARAVHACRLDYVQLSGSETARDARAIARRVAALAPRPVRLLKAVHVSSAEDVTRCAEYPADAFLLDAPAVDGRMGGTGSGFHWEFAADPPWSRARVWLAGGLHAGNVAEAVAALRPAFVDVSSGVEDSPGRKSAAKIAAFIAAAGAVPAEAAP